MTDLEQYLTNLGWEREKTDIDVRWTDPKGEWQVAISEHGKWWELGKFTDSDVYVPDFGYEAQGRFESVDMGETLDELKIAFELAKNIASYRIPTTVNDVLKAEKELAEGPPIELPACLRVPPSIQKQSEASRIVRKVCNEYCNSDLRADNKDIQAAFDARIEELKKTARKYDRLLTMLAEKAWAEENENV